MLLHHNVHNLQGSNVFYKHVLILAYGHLT